MKRSEFLKRGGAVAVLAVVAPKALVDKAVAAPAPAVVAGPAATTLTVGDGSVFRAGDIVRVVSSGEAMWVTKIEGNAIDVVRGIGSQEPQPIKRGDEILMVAAAVERGASLLNDRFLPRLTAGLQPVKSVAA